MGRIKSVIPRNSSANLCGAKIIFTEVVGTLVGLESVDGDVRIDILLPTYEEGGGYIENFTIRVDVLLGDPEDEESMKVCNQIIADLKKAYKFKDSQVTRSIAPTASVYVFEVSEGRLINTSVLEREYNKIIKILKKY